MAEVQEEVSWLKERVNTLAEEVRVLRPRATDLECSSGSTGPQAAVSIPPMVVTTFTFIQPLKTSEDPLHFCQYALHIRDVYLMIFSDLNHFIPSRTLIENPVTYDVRHYTTQGPLRQMVINIGHLYSIRPSGDLRRSDRFVQTACIRCLEHGTNTPERVNDKTLLLLTLGLQYCVGGILLEI